MKCVMINTTDIIGGAALAGYSIFQSLNEHSSFDTNILCGWKYSQEKKIAPILNKKQKLGEAIFRKIFIDNTVGQSYWLPSALKLLGHPFLEGVDIINLQNIHGGYFSYPIIKRLAKIAPVVITMHDMWYLTGHCAYAFSCNGWETGCQKCPHLDWQPPIKFDSAGFHWKQKRKIFNNDQISFIASSHWLKKKAEQSSLFQGKEIKCIYNPLDSKNFIIKPKNIVKEALNLPQDKNIICFGSADAGNPRKGFPDFIKRLTPDFVRKNNLFLTIMGEDTKNVVKDIPQSLIPYKYFGSVSNQEFRCLIYNAADVFIFPTLAENLPNMVIEAMLSGTPCVTFDTGGCGEVVKTEITGTLVRTGDFVKFNEKIAETLKNKEALSNMSINCRKFVEEKLSPQKCADEYSKVFMDSIKIKR
jgi:glycosyltransferase involved in cell wall biosynthesis